MATVGISKGIAVTLKYYPLKSQKDNPGRNHVETMFAFKSLVGKTKQFLKSDITFRSSRPG